MRTPHPRWSRTAAWLAAISCVVAIIGFAAALEGFRHDQHPFGLLGASGMPNALGFNIFGFLVPGGLLAVCAVALRGRLPAASGPTAGIGVWLLALSALAFAAQGVFPLDPQELDAGRSQWHATAWTLWWIAFVPGATLLATGTRRVTGWGRWAALMFACASGVLVLTVLTPSLVPGPIAQRLGLGVWLAAYVAAANRTA